MVGDREVDEEGLVPGRGADRSMYHTVEVDDLIDRDL